MTCTLTVLGCSGGISDTRRTTSFLLNNDTLIDCGTGVGDLSLTQLAAIDRVFLTHSHLDHIACLPLMLDAVGAERSQPLAVYGLPETLAALRTHVFNNIIWPDFTRIPSPEAPWLTCHPITVGDTLALPGAQITVLPAGHSIPAAGYAIDSGDSSLVFTGDSGPCEAFWNALQPLNRLSHLLIETSFSNAEQALAQISGHYCPQTLGQALNAHAPANLTLWISHLKPGGEQQILDEIQTASRTPTQALTRGQQITF